MSTTPDDTPAVDSNMPLAARMRPRSLDEVVGQDHLLTPGSPLRTLADPDRPTSGSHILYGPPGTGKTTITTAIASTTDAEFVTLSATDSGVKEVRALIAAAKKRSPAPTIVFIDEIHRFSKSQQDALLPATESGTIALIGATTENPSFSLNSALMSRSRLHLLHALDNSDIETLLRRALADHDRGVTTGNTTDMTVSDDVLDLIATTAAGDARAGLTILEAAVNAANARDLPEITTELVTTVIGDVAARYDRDGDQHYDIISAFIKSMRGSDPDAAVYWLARLIAGGEDPRFIARRLIVHASEDVGLADPSVLPVCVAAAQAVQLVGLPEARINLTQATLAIATAPKSNGVIKAINAAEALVAADPNTEVPVHLRDAHYPGAKMLGHGVGYDYPHDHLGHVTDDHVDYLPESVRGLTDTTPVYGGPPKNRITGGVYVPSGNGHEAVVRAVLTGNHDHQHQSHH